MCPGKAVRAPGAVVRRTRPSRSERLARRLRPVPTLLVAITALLAVSAVALVVVGDRRYEATVTVEVPGGAALYASVTDRVASAADADDGELVLVARSDDALLITATSADHDDAEAIVRRATTAVVDAARARPRRAADEVVAEAERDVDDARDELDELLDDGGGVDPAAALVFAERALDRLRTARDLLPDGDAASSPELDAAIAEAEEERRDLVRSARRYEQLVEEVAEAEAVLAAAEDDRRAARQDPPPMEVAVRGSRVAAPAGQLWVAALASAVPAATALVVLPPVQRRRRRRRRRQAGHAR